MNGEIRAGVELRAFEEDGRPVIEGTAIVFDQPSVDLGFREVIAPGAVTLDGDVVLNFDHQSAYILGRQSNNTLAITSDERGVHFRAYPPDTSWVRDLIVSMREGFISQCSFEFFARDDHWENKAGEVWRTVTDALVSALSVVAQPAYPQTSAEARSKAEAVRQSTSDTTTPGGAPELVSDTPDSGGAPEPKPETVYVEGIGFVPVSPT